MEPTNITIDAKDLQTALKFIAPSISKRATLPVLQNVGLQVQEGALVVTACNLDTSSRTTVELLDSTPGEGWALTVPYKQVAELLPKTGRLVLAPVAGPLVSLGVQEDGTRYQFNGLRFEEAPTLPDDGWEPVAWLSAEVMGRIQKEIVPATLDEDTRPVLHSVLFRFAHQEGTFVAADGFRLHKLVARAEYEPDAAGDYLLPREVFLALAQLRGAVRMERRQPTPNMVPQVRFVADNGAVWGRTTEGRFPNYEMIVPFADRAPALFTVQVSEWLKVLDKLARVSKDNANLTHWRWNPEQGILTGEATNGEGTTITSTVPAPGKIVTDGTPEARAVAEARATAEWGVDGRYLTQAIKPYERVTFYVNAVKGGPYLLTAGNDVQLVIMPMNAPQ